MHGTARPGSGPVGTEDSLTRLLETEARLAERLAAAEAEAARIRQAAIESARAAEATVQADVDAALGSLTTDHAQLRAARLAEIDAEKGRRTDALRSLPCELIARLADEAVERLLQDAARGAP